MDIRKLQRVIVDGLEDVKAQDIVVFNTEHLSPLFERVIIASGTSNRHTKSLAASVRDQVRAQGGRVLSTEGSDTGEWIIVDCGAAVVHVMQPAIRTYYHLEEIWGDKPVKIKLGETQRALPKASEPAAEVAAKRPARKLSTPPTLAQKVAAKQTAARQSSAASQAPARKAAAKKTVARKAAAQPAAPVKTVATRAPAAKKAAVKTTALKTTASRVAAKQVVAKKAPAKKAAAKQAPIRTVIVAPKKSEAPKPARKTLGKSPAKKAPAKKAARKA